MARSPSAWVAGPNARHHLDQGGPFGCLGLCDEAQRACYRVLSYRWVRIPSARQTGALSRVGKASEVAMNVQLEARSKVGGLAGNLATTIDRRRTGSVYTPADLAEFVLDTALDDRPELLDGSVLDPACGAGVFLAVVARRIARRLVDRGLDLGAPKGHSEFLEALNKQLFGVDINPTAVLRARATVANEVRRLSPGRLPNEFLARNITVGDFTDPRWHISSPPNLIVGNPPYVPVDRLPPEDLTRIRRDFITARGRIDLYTVFMQRASDMVALGGRWTFITSDKFLTSESARALRQYLGDRGAVRSVSRFQTHDLFDDAATVPCVTVWDRAPTKAPVQLLFCTASSSSGQVRITSRDTLPRSVAIGSTWRLSRRRERALAERITAGHAPLSDVVSRLSAGPATGLNAAFLVPTELARQVEPELLVPTVGGRDITAHRIVERGQSLLLPYRWDQKGEAHLIDLADYPKARAWLRSYRPALENRHCVRKWGHPWWDLHDPLRDALHRRPKVLVPDVARTNRFAADLGRFIPQHSVYYLLPNGNTDPVVLAALLNSAAAEFLVRTQAPVVKDGFRRYRRQFLLNLPVPEVSPHIAGQIRALAVAGPSDALTDLVDSCFSIDPSEIRAALRATYEVA